MKVMGCNSPLQIHEVRSIIEGSAKAGVIELQFNGLHVTFGKPTGEEMVNPPHMPQAAPPAVSAEQHENQTKAAIEKDEVDLREEQLAHALVTDPLRYEELLLDGELTDELDTSDRGDGSEDD